MEVFGRESLSKRAFGIASELGERVAKKNSLKNKDFLIISQRESISILCLAWIEATAAATANVTTLVINC